MIRFFILLTLCLPLSAYAQLKQPTAQEQTAIAQRELEQIDKKYSSIRDSGIERFQRFINAYVFPNTKPGAYRETQLAEYFGILNNVGAGPNISYEDAVRLTEALVHFARPEQFITLKINAVPKDKSLFRSFTFYTIGLQRALDRLGQTDLEHQGEIDALKKRITRVSSEFFLKTRRIV